jgi:hypothetical protein
LVASSIASGGSWEIEVGFAGVAVAVGACDEDVGEDVACGRPILCGWYALVCVIED